MDFDNFSQSIVNGEPSAINMAKTLLSTPILIYTGEYATGNGFGTFIKETQLPFAVPLEVESHQMAGNAEVSESTVIAKGQKVTVADNVAPGSWSWNLSGYIPGISGLEPTNYFTPFVMLHTELLKKAFKRGYVMIFKDMDASIYRRVVIKSLTLSTKSDCANKKPFSMELKEINVMDDKLASATEATSSATTVLGSSLGSVISLGCTAAAVGTVGSIAQAMKS